MGKKVKVHFLPHNITVEVDEGTTILDAARAAGIGIRSVCGGKGLCGKCKVIVRRGRVEHRETDLLSKEEIKRGYVLACLARVVEDVEIEIPVESLIGKARLQATVSLPQFTPSPYILKKSLTLSDVATYKIAEDVKAKMASMGREVFYAIVNEDRKKVIDVSPSDKGVYGVAVDIGTTKIVVALVDIANGKVIATDSEFNKQLLYGEDIISRIRYALDKKGGLKEVQRAAVETINTIIHRLCKMHNVKSEDIYMVTAAGNTAMTYLFVGLDPYPLIKSFKEAPNIPRDPYWLEARDLGLDVNRNADVYVLPCAGRFLGGDVIGDVITAQMHLSEEPVLLIDIGTNTEVVIGCKEWFIGTTAPAGPAFEGWGLTCGVRAVAGAIESVVIDQKTCRAIYKTIGGAKPIGICGSGYIDLLAQLFINGLIDPFGKFYRDCGCPYIRPGEKGYEYVVVPANESGTGRDIVVTEQDIYNLIDSKSSVCAAISILLKNMYLSVYDVKKVVVCGVFGNYLNLNSAIAIGMIPEFPNAQVVYIGNGSLGGSILSLLSKEYRDAAERVAKLMAVIELMLDPNFMDEYQAGFILPGKKELFPSWASTAKNIKPWKPQ